MDVCIDTSMHIPMGVSKDMSMHESIDMPTDI